MVAGAGSKPPTVEERLDALEAHREGIPFDLRDRLEALEALTVPPIPNDLCERLDAVEGRARLARESIEGLEEGAKDTGREVSALERRNSVGYLERILKDFEAGIDRRFAEVKADVEEIADNLRTRIEGLERPEAGLGAVEERATSLEAFRSRFDADLVHLTRRIAAVEDFTALERLEVRTGILERLPPRILDLERARDLVLSKLKDLGAWTSPPDLDALEETLRNEAAELTGRANTVGDDGEAPFDGAAAEALYRVGSTLTTAARALMMTLKQ